MYLHNGAVSCTTVLNGAYYYQLGQQSQGTQAQEQPVELAAEPAPEPETQETEPPQRPTVTTAPISKPIPSPSDEDWLTFE